MPKGPQGWMTLRTREDRVLCQRCALFCMGMGYATGMFLGGKATAFGLVLGLSACLPVFYLLRYLRDLRRP